MQGVLTHGQMNRKVREEWKNNNNKKVTLVCLSSEYYCGRITVRVAGMFVSQALLEATSFVDLLLQVPEDPVADHSHHHRRYQIRFIRSDPSIYGEE